MSDDPTPIIYAFTLNKNKFKKFIDISKSPKADKIFKALCAYNQAQTTFDNAHLSYQLSQDAIHKLQTSTSDVSVDDIEVADKKSKDAFDICAKAEIALEDAKCNYQATSSGVIDEEDYDRDDDDDDDEEEDDMFWADFDDIKKLNTIIRKLYPSLPKEVQIYHNHCDGYSYLYIGIPLFTPETWDKPTIKGHNISPNDPFNLENIARIKSIMNTVYSLCGDIIVETSASPSLQNIQDFCA